MPHLIAPRTGRFERIVQFNGLVLCSLLTTPLLYKGRVMRRWMQVVRQDYVKKIVGNIFRTHDLKVGFKYVGNYHNPFIHRCVLLLTGVTGMTKKTCKKCKKTLHRTTETHKLFEGLCGACHEGKRIRDSRERTERNGGCLNATDKNQQ